jgi:hypothetical protein
LRRVRQARHQLLTDTLRDPYYDSPASMRGKVRLLGSLLRPNAPEISMAVLTHVLCSAAPCDDKLALILSQEAKRLEALDRYERRALSRRNRFIQVFDRAVACRCIEDNFYARAGKTKPKKSVI